MGRDPPPPPPPRPPALLFPLGETTGPSLLQMSLLSVAPSDCETNFSIKFIGHENGFSWAVKQSGEELNYLNHKFIQ